MYGFQRAGCVHLERYHANGRLRLPHFERLVCSGLRRRAIA